MAKSIAQCCLNQLLRATYSYTHTHTHAPPLLDDDDGDDEEHILTDITDVFTEEIYIYMPFKPLHQYVLQGYGRYGLS